MEKQKKDNAIVNLTFSFSLEVIKFCEQLESQKKWVIANQLLKSGTSIGANVWEAQHAESKADFIHKLKIASKEANETEYWLMLCKQSEGYPENTLLEEKLKEINKILSKIIATTKNNYA